MMEVLQEYFAMLREALHQERSLLNLLVAVAESLQEQGAREYAWRKEYGSPPSPLEKRMQEDDAWRRGKQNSSTVQCCSSIALTFK